MNGYEKLVDMMKYSAPKSNSFALGEMTSQTICRIGSLELEPEDYLINETIKDTLEEGDTVLIVRHTEDTYIILAKVV